MAPLARKPLRVFIGCPGDMAPERAALLSLEKHLSLHECPVEFLIWPDVPPAAGRPQQAIFDHYPVETWDIFVGLLWSRFGTDAGETDQKTGKRMTGTEEEFKRAYAAWQSSGNRKPHIAIYRSAKALPIRHDRQQFDAVARFFDQLSANGDYPALCQEFKTTAAFKARVEEDLLKIIRKLNETEAKPAIAEEVVRLPAAEVRIPGVPHNLREPRAAIYGRKAQLDALFARLSANLAGGGVALSGLRGMGGVGKTELALALARELTPSCPDGQFFVDLLGMSGAPLPPVRIAEAVLRAFEPGAPPFEDARAAVDALVQVLHAWVKTAFLLVLDNAHDAAQVEPFLRLPRTVLIVTSRERLVLAGVPPEDVDTLAPADATQLLTAETGGRLAGDAATEAAALCGCLPVALLAFAGAVALATRPTAELLTLLRDRRQNDTREAIDTVFSLSEDQLRENLRLRWRQLSVFPGDFDRAGAAAVWSEADEEAAQRDLDALHHRHLLEWDEATSRFRLHDLACPYAVAHLAAGETEGARRRHAEYYCAVLGTADHLYLSQRVLDGLALYDRERVNIATGQAWAAATAGEAADRLQIAYPNAGVYLLSLRRHPREQIIWLESALAASRQSGDRQTEGNALGNLGNCWGALGEPRKAIDFYEQSLVIAREIGDRHSEGIGLGNLGTSWAQMGEPRKAIGFYEPQLVIAREIGDRRSEGNALGNLGTSLVELGEPRKAIDFYEQALVIDREIGDRGGEGADLGNLGNCWADLGEPRKAIGFHEQSLVIDREIGNRRGEGSALGNLGNCWADLGEPLKAIDFYEQQLGIAREIGDRRGEGNALGNLGNRWAQMGEPRKAINFYEQALVIGREIGDRGGEGTALYNLGNTVWQIGERRRAVGLLEESLRIKEKIEDPWAPRVRAWLEEMRKELAGAEGEDGGK